MDYPTYSAKSNALSTLVGLSRTMSSPGTPLRRPYSSAGSAPHVAGTGAGGDVEKILGIFTDRRDALHLYERIGRSLIVRADHRSRVPGQGAAFGGVLAGVEREFAVIDDKPDGRDQRSAV